MGHFKVIDIKICSPHCLYTPLKDFFSFILLNFQNIVTLLHRIDKNLHQTAEQCKNKKKFK